MRASNPCRRALLFTDIEGSTQLVQRLGSRWAELVRTHRRVCRQAWTRWDGQEVDTAGDGFFVVFIDPRAAAEAAVEAQRGLASATWPGGEPVRVRMGVHVGEVTEYDGSWIGYEVHRAARIAAAAHGGQVVASAEVVEQLNLESTQTGLTVVDLGTFRLKDLAVDERLFQLAAEGLEVAFPPLRSVGSWTTPPELQIPATMRNSGDLPPATVGVDGRRVEVTGRGLRIGRAPDNDLVISDGDASRHHAVISGTNAGFVLTDIASTNGTLVNAARVDGARLLVDQDVIAIGAVTLSFSWPMRTAADG